MKRTFKLSTGVFGEGDPKICAPIVGRTKEDVFKAAEVIAKTEADVVEWRGDWFDRVEDRDELLEVLQGIRGRIREKALLFTLRTVYEGGQLAVMKDTYYELNERAARSGYVDLVDVEAFREEERTSEEIRKLQSAGVHVIASFHNFRLDTGQRRTDPPSDQDAGDGSRCGEDRSDATEPGRCDDTDGSNHGGRPFSGYSGSDHVHGSSGSLKSSGRNPDRFSYDLCKCGRSIRTGSDSHRADESILSAFVYEIEKQAAPFDTVRGLLFL